MTRTYTTIAHDYGRPLIWDAHYDDPTLDLSSDIQSDTTVVFIMRPRNSTTVTINRAPVTVLPSPALRIIRLRYDWVAPQLDTPGVYDGEFEATLTGGAVSGPTLGRINIVIDEDLG